MKTSNKLLLGFSGVLVLLMLSSAIILRANYSKGITNTNEYNPKEDPDYQKASLLPFRALILTSQPAVENNKGDKNLSINQSSDYSLQSFKNATFRQTGDTLYIDITKPGSLTLNCSDLQYIRNNTAYDISLNNLVSSRLEINANSPVHTWINNAQIKSLSYTGAPSNALEIGEENKLDSVKITLQKKGSLYFYASYNYGDIRVDSLRDLNLSGKAVSSLKTIN